MKSLLGILVFFPVFAWAQSPTTQADLTSRTTVQASDVFGSPCPYPDAPLRTEAQGVTELSYRITSAKTVTDVAILKSSGSVELDQAAIACIRNWNFAKASWIIAGTRSDSIRWSIPDSAAAASKPAEGDLLGKPHDCQPWYPREEFQANVGGTVRVQFTITRSGNIRDPHVVVSSGHTDFDQAALACVATWRYRPAMLSGAPVEKSWTADVRWAPSPPSQESGQ